MGLSCLVATWFLGACTPPPGDPPDSTPAYPDEITAFVDVSVVSMADEELDEGRTVIVYKGHILDIVEAEVELPPKATIINGTGRYLMPGLVDMHVHNWYEDDHILFVANGVTTVRNLWGDPIHLKWRREIKRGDRIGPRIYTTGPIMDGNPPIWSGSEVVTTVDGARQSVLMQKEAGYDAIKVYNLLAKDVWQAIIDTADQEGLPVVGHVPDAVGYEAVIESSQQTVEHLNGFIDAA
ncbi:MAG: hypothetical protein HN348_28860, partial [Proteobacteria bacterium]|nr:hypothetical protein [Pseudomonadota bacterium]